MAQTHNGRILQFCNKHGLDYEFYKKQRKAGLKWCTGCKEWHAFKEFGKDKTRYDGFAAMCLDYRSRFDKRRYVPKTRVSKKGARFVPARDNDKNQARARVNRFVRVGILPNPNELPCVDCGHTKESKEKRRHEYDHYKGYKAEHQETVEVVCSICHKKRTNKLYGKRNRNKLDGRYMEHSKGMYKSG